MLLTRSELLVSTVLKSIIWDGVQVHRYLPRVAVLMFQDAPSRRWTSRPRASILVVFSSRAFGAVFPISFGFVTEPARFSDLHQDVRWKVGKGMHLTVPLQRTKLGPTASLYSSSVESDPQAALLRSVDLRMPLFNGEKMGTVL